MIPKDNLDLVGLRALCPTTKIRGLFTTLRNGDIDTYKDWKGRYKQNLDKMKTGQLTEVAKVLKNLRLVSSKKSLSFREKKMYERAKYFIVSEVAHVKKIDENEAEKQVERALESSMEKRLAEAEAKATTLVSEAIAAGDVQAVAALCAAEAALRCWRGICFSRSRDSYSRDGGA